MDTSSFLYSLSVSLSKSIAIIVICIPIHGLQIFRLSGPKFWFWKLRWKGSNTNSVRFVFGKIFNEHHWMLNHLSFENIMAFSLSEFLFCIKPMVTQSYMSTLGVGLQRPGSNVNHRSTKLELNIVRLPIKNCLQTSMWYKIGAVVMAWLNVCHWGLG